MATPKSELMRRLREERRSQGLVRLEIWAPKEAHEEIKRAAERILKKRKPELYK